MRPRELARRTGVSTDTLRHYERKGLLPPPPRTAGGYREYPPAAVLRVTLIQRSLTIGFSLEDLKRVLGERASGGTPCQGVRAIVADRLARLEVQLTEMRTLRSSLRALLRDWDARLTATPAGARAHLLDGLAETTTPPVRKRGASPAGGTNRSRTISRPTGRNAPPFRRAR